ncbi:MarR family transcriptional regulator [Pontibacter sp. BT310]|uniref:MarR family transcriptional regulator n=1 Tax=Pontibacter populi TaxID=890055 RepID=A0ABS6X6X2_9BACT|nr:MULTISPECIES: MarR family transcriptional regulator [Pontibacter]MBJ6116896.1 MarR family transcriptional regulator [Pontibacter sp. BT310]MBR0569320.1 MarR family transcriptional regulator [Microvirga sp. STS03]MBW3363749.1 MarR family transcriptional regulator [Pontibacter populi]
MKIEEEIKQSAFKSEYHKAFINMLYTASWLELEQSNLFKPFGITLPQYNVLRILRGQHPKPATVSMLIERMLDKTSNASRIVDKLEVKELVTRKQCPNDRRTVDVLITDKGLALLKELDVLDDNNKTGIHNLTEEETIELNRILDKVRQ